MATATDMDLNRDAVIARIRTALKRRSGKAWSVTGGSGTAWGWIQIHVPPKARTWRMRDTGQTDERGYPVYADENTGEPGHQMGPADRAELARLLGLSRPVHDQGVSIAASSAYYREYVDRAEGRAPSVIGVPYWD